MASWKGNSISCPFFFSSKMIQQSSMLEFSVFNMSISLEIKWGVWEWQKSEEHLHRDRNTDKEHLESGPPASPCSYPNSLHFSPHLNALDIYVGILTPTVGLESDWDQIGTKLLISGSQDEHLVRDSRKIRLFG